MVFDMHAWYELASIIHYKNPSELNIRYVEPWL